MSDNEIKRGVNGDAIILWEDGTLRTYMPEAVLALGDRFKGGYFRPQMTREEEFNLLFACTDSLYRLVAEKEKGQISPIDLHVAYKRLISMYPYFGYSEMGEVDFKMNEKDLDWNTKIQDALRVMGWQEIGPDGESS